VKKEPIIPEAGTGLWPHEHDCDNVKSVVGFFARRITLALLIGVVAVTASGQQIPAPLPEVASYGGRIEVRKDLAFGTEPYQKLDLYLPKGEGPFPVVVCWFGGGFSGGDKGGMARIGAFMAAHGIAAVAPGYFLTDAQGEHPGWPKNVNDAKAAVRFVRFKSGEWHLDPARIAALGHSSGAYLALMVGFTPHLKELEGDGAAKDESSAVIAVVDISGVCDRRGSLGTTTAPLLGKGYEVKDDLRALASPIIYVGPKTVPVYILHGDKDPSVDVSSAKQLAAALQVAKVPHELHIVSAGHDPISPETMESVVGWLGQRLSR
jgi:acetyl esterase/lipase